MQISILGCGWLGFSLAKQLSITHKIKGSVTQQSKIDLLSQHYVEPYLINLNLTDSGDIDGFLSGCDILIICIPPKSTTQTELAYSAKIAKLVPFIICHNIKKVIFTSSISVYADSENMPVITEATMPSPETENAKQILKAEGILQSNNNAFNVTILRLGGLIGDTRHPVYYLAGKTNLPNPLAPVNLASKHYVIKVIEKIIQHSLWHEMLLVCEPNHPTREDFYTNEAQKLNLPLPLFSHQEKSKGKLVNSLIINDKFIEN